MSDEGYKVTFEITYSEATGARSALQKAENSLKNAEEAAKDAEGEITSIRRSYQPSE